MIAISPPMIAISPPMIAIFDRHAARTSGAWPERAIG
jgi:hypothetical protein